MASPSSPSKSVRSAILMALAGVISIGISPGTLAIVISSTSANLADLMGLGTPVATEVRHAGDLSSPDKAEVSYSGLLSDGLSLLQAALDETLPDTASSPAQAAINGLSPNLGSLSNASFSSFGTPS